jgi:ABC-type nitrate/sulfonate/bicarbonate transport system substrate-binding protein
MLQRHDGLNGLRGPWRVYGGVAAAVVFVLAVAGCGGGAAAPSVASASSSAVPAKPASAAPSSSASGSPAAGQLVRVRSAYTAPSVVNGPLWVGLDEGIFRKNGLDVSLELVKDTAVPPALQGNELDFALGGGNEVVRSDLGGSSLVMVATASDYPIFSLLVNKKYTKVQELAGQKIGITQAGSATDVAAHLFFDHYQMLDAVKLTPTGTVPAIFAALSQGLLAGGILSPPTSVKATQQGFVELINGFKLGVPLTHAGVLVSRAYVASHRDVVQRILKAYAESWTYCANPANKAQIVKAVAKYTKSATPQAEEAYAAMLPVWQKKAVPTVDPAGIAGVLKLTDDPKAKTAKPEQFLDNSIIQAVAH